MRYQRTCQGAVALFLLALSTCFAFAQPTTPSFVPGCVYNAVAPTLADKQLVPWQCDINGKLITTGSGSGGLTIGTSTITNGSNGLCLFDDNGVVGEQSCAGVAADIAVGTTVITGGTNGRILGVAAGVLSEFTTSGSGTVVCLATSCTLVTPALGTPTSGTLTNTTGFPAANLAGLGTGVATFLATPSSANLASAVTDETGSGALVFANTPTLVTPALGVATASSLAIAGCTIGTDELCVTGQTTLSSTLTLSSISGSTQCLQVNSSGVVAGSGGTCGGSGTPGGLDTQVQFNDGGAFGGDAGLTYNKTTNVLTNTGGGVVSTGGTITASLPAFSATQTWNSGAVTFSAIDLDVTRTAAADASTLLDLKTSGSTRFKVEVGNTTGSWPTQNVKIDQFAAITQTLASAANNAGFGFLISGDSSFRLAFGNDSGTPFLGMGPGNATRDIFISRNSANVMQFGTTASNASGAWLAAKGTLTGGTLASAANVMAVTATLNGSPSGTQTAIVRTITSSTGTASNTVQVGENFTLAAAYTGSGLTLAQALNNTVAGTNTKVLPTSLGTLDGSGGNMGNQTVSSGTTTGSNIGFNGVAANGNINVGMVGLATTDKNSATNIGVIGLGANAGSSPVQIGGWFSLINTMPTVSAALIADNGAQTSPIFLARDNGTTVFSIADAGLVTMTLTTDSAKTTRTVCQQTSDSALYFGSGALGVCAGTSSIRFKHDLAPLAQGLAELSKIDTVSFYFNKGYGDDGATQKYGFTAENVNEALPKLVNLDAEGRPTTIDWSGLLPVIVNAIKELKADNDNLRQRLRRIGG